MNSDNIFALSVLWTFFGILFYARFEDGANFAQKLFLGILCGPLAWGVLLVEVICFIWRLLGKIK